MSTPAEKRRRIENEMTVAEAQETAAEVRALSTRILFAAVPVQSYLYFEPPNPHI